ncbi:hypothetical protein U0070_015646, partial [Myodes glareolus]
PLEPVPICFLLFFDRKLLEGQPRPLLSPALPLSSPLWTENTRRSPPATHPADMGTDRAVRLGSAILGLLLLQEILQKSSQISLVSSQLVTPRPSTTDSPSLSLPGLTSLQPQKHTMRLGAGTETPDGGGGSSSSTSPSLMHDTHSISDMSLNATPSSVTTSLQTREEVTAQPSPTSASMLTVAAFGVISFIVILVVVGITLASVVSLRFMCQKNKESEDPQKPGSSGLSESCSTANGEKDSITLISMKNINTNNSKGCSAAEKRPKQKEKQVDQGHTMSCGNPPTTTCI